MTDATEEPAKAEDKKDGEGAGDEEDEEDEEGEGEIEELDLREAAGNNEVCWSASEVEKMKQEYEAILNGGPIAPADKVAVPCPHCDKRAFKYLRSMEKHVWNEHGVKLTREEMDASRWRSGLAAPWRVPCPAAGGRPSRSPRSSPSTTTRCTTSSPWKMERPRTTKPSRRGRGSACAWSRRRAKRHARGRTRGPARHPVGSRRAGPMPHLRRGGPGFLEHRERLHRHVRRLRRSGAPLLLRAL